MGGAQPLAATMAGASLLAIECQPNRASRSASRRGYLDRRGAQPRCRRWRSSRRHARDGKPVSVGLLRQRGARSCPSCCGADVRPDAVTDQTSAHDPVNGYLPVGWTRGAVGAPAAQRSAGASPRAARESMAPHVEAMLGVQAPRAAGVRLRQQHPPGRVREGVQDAFDFPGFVPAYIRPLFCRGMGPFRWVALSGDPEDIYRTDAKVKELLPDDRHLHHWLDMARAAHPVPGPAGAHLLGRAWASGIGSGWPSTRWWRAASSRRRSSSAAIISIPARSPAPTARPRRCAMAPMRSPTGRCSTRCSTPPAAPPGCRSITAAASAWAIRSTPAWSSCATAPTAAARRIERVLWNDPATGVMRHADAGYPQRHRLRARARVDLPMLGDRERADGARCRKLRVSAARTGS